MTPDEHAEFGADAGHGKLIVSFARRCADVTAELVQHDEHGINPEIHTSVAWACRKIASQVRQFPELKTHVSSRLAKALQGFEA